MATYQNTLSPEEEQIARDIVDAAYTVHKALGPGLLERVYEVCFCHELTKRGHVCQRQLMLPIVFDGITFDEGLKLDVLVDDTAICELKSSRTGAGSVACPTAVTHENDEEAPGISDQFQRCCNKRRYTSVHPVKRRV